MKFSLCTDLLYLEIGPTGPVFSDTNKLLDGMDLAKKLGMKAVEFWDWFNKDWEKLLARKEEYGLEVTAMVAKGGRNLYDPATLEDTLQGMKETIEIAKKFNCPNVIVNAGQKADADRAAAKESIVNMLKQMAPMVEEAGITLNLEPLSDAYFLPAKEAFEIIEEVGSPNVKLLYDIFHYQMREGNIVDTIRANVDKIGHIHLAGVPGRHEIVNNELDYTYILREIGKTDYQGWIALEYLPTMEKEASVKACLDVINNL